MTQPSTSHERRSWQRRIWLLTAAVLALYNTAVGYLGYREFAEALREAHFQEENTARLLAQEIRTNFEFVFANLESLTLLLNQLPPVEYDDHALSLVKDLMVQQAGRLESIRDFIVIDHDGKVVMDERGRKNAGLVLSDRDYFRAHVEQSAAAAFIGKPVLGRTSGKWFVGVSHRWEDASGQFAGVVAAVVEPAAFVHALSRAEVGGSKALAVAMTDGTVIAHSAGGDSLIGKPTTADAAFRHDGRADPLIGGRLLATQPVPGFPVSVHASLDRHEILAERSEQLYGHLLAMVLPSIAGLGLVAMLMRQQQFLRDSRQILKRHVADLKASHAALTDSEARYRLLAENSGDAIIRITADNRRLYVSPSIQKLTGWEPSEFTAKPHEGIVHPDDWDNVQNSLLSGGEIILRWRYRHRDGHYVWVEGRGRTVEAGPGEPFQYVMGIRDISVQQAAEQALEAANAKLTRLATTDHLTGLANRRHFESAFATEWMRARRESKPLSVLMVDVDHFKKFNDTHGHQMGDECLIAVAATIQNTLKRVSDVVGRYGGEEFVVLLPGTDAGGAQRVAERIRAEIQCLQIAIQPDRIVRVTASIGTATTIPRMDDLPAALIAEADAALYEAKQRGRNCVVPLVWCTDAAVARSDEVG